MGKRFFFALLFFLTMSWTVADTLLGFTADYGRTVTVPSVCGLRESDLSLPDWAETESTYRYDANTPAGIILSQSPEAGREWKIAEGEKRILSITVSLGDEKKTIPPIIGKNAREATAILRDMGFAVTETRVSGGVQGEVIGVTPTEGSEITVGETVTLTVSDGEAVGTVTVPNLLGLSRGHALIELFRSDLGVDTVREEYSDAPEGTVIRQSPTPGSVVAPGTKLSITVSRGKKEASIQDNEQDNIS
jgi:serine/threonine-protein kinase